ncbi:MAG: DUF3843 family protein [Prevotellaceae bacterium]|jgi:hypothetical protein|nr:DUF3843 family protein [Prevotellaceae bacterium]
MKFKNINFIPAQQFQELHPRISASNSDIYYARLANNILKTLMHDEAVTSNFEPYLLKRIALHSAAYLEDVISGLGLFAAFRSLHQKLCGRKLPFVSLDEEDYYDDEINQPDIQLLVWFIKQEDSNEQEEDGVRFTNPDNPVLEYISNLIMDILEDEYENAPENNSLFVLLHSDIEFDSYFQFRELLHWLHYNSYLSMQYPKRECQEEIESLLKSKNETISKNKEQFIYSTQVTRIFTKVCSPLAITAAEWLKEITTNDSLKGILDAVELRPHSTYEIVHHFGKEVKIHPVDDENDIMYLDANSADGLEKNRYLLASLVFFNNLWQVNGFAAFLSSDKKEKLKKIDKENSNEDNILFTYEEIMKHTKNKPLIMFKDFDEYLVFWKKVFPDTPNIDEFVKNNILKDKKNLLLFSDNKYGTTILPDAASWIKSPNNKLYNKEKAEEYAVSILFGATPATFVLISYLIENNLLPDACVNSLLGKERGRQLVAENEWFIVRFFQPDLFVEK